MIDRRQLQNKILIKKAIIRADEGLIKVYADQLRDGVDCEYLSEALEELRAAQRAAKSELITFQKLLEEMELTNVEN